MKLKICCQPLKAYKKPSGLYFSTIENHFLINRNVQLSFWVSVLEFVKRLTFVGRILENHQREQKESYETQVEGLKLKVDHLENENSKLQNLFQEKSNVNENICQEVSRLSSENSVCHCTFYSIRHGLKGRASECNCDVCFNFIRR